MGLLEIAQNYTPRENQEFGNKKKLIGDAVCQLTLEKVASKKTGKEWIVLKAEAIHTIPDDKGRETTLEPGDSIDKVYDPEDNDKLQELADDLFTSGIKYENAPTEEMQFASMKASTDGKLAYYRTWAKDLTPDQKKKYPNNTAGYFQNIKILSSSKITQENSTPQVAF